MFSSRFIQISAVLGGLLVSLSALAGQSITIQGRVQDASGNPLNGALTQFRVQILTPDASRCVLYDESQVIDLSQTNGLFSINLNNGTGTVNAPATYTLEQAISNLKGFAVNSSYCASGSGTVNYSPAATDNRKLVIQFRDPGSMSGFETIPEMDLNPVAIAMESRTLGGFPASSVLRVQDSGAVGTTTPLSSANFTELLSLLAGTSNNYMSSSGSSTAGARLPSYNGNPSMPAVGSIWFDTLSGSGVLKYRDSSGVQTLGTGGGGSGTITGVTAGGALTGGGSSGAVTISLPTTGVTGFGSAVGSASAVPVITYDSYGRLTAVTTAAISGTLPTGTSGQFLKSSGGSAWAGASILMGDLKNTDGSLPLFGTVTCTASQSMYWDSGADQIRCQNIAIGNSQISDVAWGKLTGVPNLVANAGGTPSLLTDTEANLPTVHVAGRIFFASDTKKIYRDNGTTWDQLGGASNAVVNALGTASITTGPTASQPSGQVSGRLFINTTTQKIQYDNGTAWIDVASNGGSGFTGSLAGEVSGTQSATQVDSINGIARSTITTNLNAVTNATDAALASQLVKRDASGDFAGRKITAAEVIVKGSTHTASITADPSADYSLKLPDAKASVNGQVLSSDTNGVLSWASPSSSFGSIAVNPPVTNTSGTIGMPSANTSRDGYLTQGDWNTFSGKLSSALNSALIWVGNGSNVATPVTPSGNVSLDNTGKFTVTGIRDQSISAAGTNVGQVLRYSATNTWAPEFLTMKDLRSTVSGTQALTSSCSAGQTLYWDSATDSLGCQSISIAASTQISGQLPIANGGTGTNSAGQNLVFAGPASSGAGAPAFRALTASDLPASASYWQAATGGINFAGGNVGIGTTAPSHRLAVENTAASSLEIANFTAPNIPSPGYVTAQIGKSATANNSALIGFASRAIATDSFSFLSVYGDDPANLGTGLIVKRGGNVGIGTTSPSAKLDLKVASQSSEGMAISASDSHSLSINPSRAAGGSNNLTQAGDASIIFSNGSIDTGGMVIGPWSSTAAGIRINSAGNVGIGSSAPSVSLDLNTRTDAIRLPAGTNAQQPGQSGQPTAANGMIRYNTSSNALEAYVNGAWTNLATVGGTQSFAGNVSVGGTLTTTGAATLNGGATIAGGALAMSNQNITGVGSNITGSSGLTIASGGTNTNLALNSSGAGAVTLGSSNGTSLSVLDGGASTVNYVTVKGAATGASPTIGTAGSDANINLTFTPKGTGSSVFNGAVGIGTSGPAVPLDIFTSSLGAIRVGSSFTTNGPRLILNSTGASGRAYQIISTQASDSPGAGKLDFYDATANVDRMVLDAAGNLGIGTNAPAAKLDIWQDGNAARLYAPYTGDVSQIFDVWGSGTPDTTKRWTLRNYNGLFSMTGGSQSTNSFSITSNGVTSLYAAANGNVGIGTTNPGSLVPSSARTHLTIQGSSDAGVVELASRAADADNSTLGLLQYDDVNSTASDKRGAALISRLSGTTANNRGATMEFWTKPDAGSLSFRMKLDANGYLGIASTTPREQLDIRGGHLFHTGGALVHAFNGYYDGSGTPTWRANGYGGTAYAGGIAFNPVSGAFTIATTPSQGAAGAAVSMTDRLAVTKDGYVGIATVNPSVPFHINASVIYPVSNYGYLNAGGAGTFSGTQNPAVSMLATGRVVAQEFNSTSDRRVKEQIKPVSDELAWRFLKEAKPVHFRWKMGEKNENFGFIAQELDKLGFHELVSATPDASLEKTVDADGYVSPAGVKFNVNYNQITALLTKILQAQESRLAVLERLFSNGDVLEIGTKLRAKVETLIKNDPHPIIEAQAREIASLKKEAEQARKEREEMKARLERLEKALRK